jgi:hypothetical protein
VPFRPSCQVCAPPPFTEPLPVIGLRGQYDLGEIWTLRGSAEIFALEYGDYSGSLYDVYAGIDYQLTRHVALGVGVDSVKSNVGIAKPNLDGDLDWRHDGGLLFLKFAFQSVPQVLRDRSFQMKRVTLIVAGMTIAGLTSADSVFDVDEMVCAAGQVQICLENDTCYASSAAELAIPDFVVIDTKAKKISTTRSSAQTARPCLRASHAQTESSSCKAWKAGVHSAS